MKLEQAFIDNFNIVVRDYSAKEEVISTRIHQILEIILEELGSGLHWWDYCGREDSNSGGGCLAENWSKDFISLYVAPQREIEDVCLDLLNNFPVNLLTMKDEDIISEIQKVKESALKAAEEARLEKAETERVKKEKKKKAMSKLSEEDRLALGLR